MDPLINIVFISIILFIFSKPIHRYFLLNKYKMIIDMFDYFLEKTYNVIYNDQIIGYTSNGHKTIPHDEMETIERNFIKLAFELMGRENEKIMSSFFGSKTVIIHNMVLYVRRELNKDELSKMIQQHERGIL